MALTKKTVNCPSCQQEVVWTEENPWRPFCSERCKLIDLGAWADENYKVKGDSLNPWLEESNDAGER